MPKAFPRGRNPLRGYFASVKEKLVRIISTGQLGIFKNGYWGHPGYKFPPEANLMLVAHYIEALDFQKDVVQIHTVFGGKNPHPNWLVGGVPLALNINGKGGADVINMERLELVLSIIKRCREFSAQVLVPDSIALAKFYPEWLHLGTGLSNQSLLAYGAFPSIANDYSQKSLLIPGGAIINGNFNEVLPVDLSDEDQIREEVGRSWYTYPKGVTSLHPYQGETVPHFELGPATKGSRTDIKQLDENAPYSWIKTPRWRGNMMEVGPLARTLIAYQLKQPDIVARVDDLCARIGGARHVAAIDYGPHPHQSAGSALGGRHHAGLLRQAHNEPQERRQHRRLHQQVGSRHMAPGSPRRRLHRGPPRRARALDGHQKQKGGRLPVCRPYHMERRTAQRRRPARPV